MRLASEPRNLG